MHILHFIKADSELKQTPSKWDLIFDVASAQNKGLESQWEAVIGFIGEAEALTKEAEAQHPEGCKKVPM